MLVYFDGKKVGRFLTTFNPRFRSMAEVPTHWLRSFADPIRAGEQLQKLCAAAEPSTLRFVERLLSEAAATPDPDRVLHAFERLASSVIDRTSFYRTLSEYPPLTARLVRIFLASEHLSDILFRDPQFVSLLISPESSCRPMSREQMDMGVHAILINPTYSSRRKIDALRGWKRQCHLRVGIRDLILDETLDAVVTELSDVADAVVEGMMHLYATDAQRRAMTVIALGKWGGRELNYSSDIDLMFVYAEEGVDEEGLSNHEAFNRIAENLMRSLNEVTREGRLYRADARLRPDGDSGPLARSLVSCLRYYESRGKLWERQMLIKARPCAGQKTLGEQLLLQLRAFVYPTTFFRSPLEEIARMKWKIEEEKLSDELNIKIAPGGIRDIEFICQALQLINGGRTQEIRTPTTLTAIDRLEQHDLLSPEEAALLRRAYRLFRRIEHCLQIERDMQTHSVDQDEREQSRLAYVLGFPSRGELMSCIQTERDSVRRHFDSMFAAKSVSPHGQSLIQEHWDVEVRSLLHQARVAPSTHVQQVLRQLAFGRFPKLYDNATRRLFESLLPKLLTTVGYTACPEEALSRFESIVYAYGSTDSLYRALTGSDWLLESLAHLCACGPHMTARLVDSPDFTERLITGLPAWLEKPADPPAMSFDSLYDLKTMEWLRLTILLLLSRIDIGTLLDQLSRIADHCVRTLWGEALGNSDGLLMAALGKWGGREISFRSDLDVVFICSEDADLEALRPQVEEWLSAVQTFTPLGRLYAVDVRLRPEGENSPLLVRESRYVEYLDTRAALWEKQALLRWRPVAGDFTIADRLRPTIDGHRYRPVTAFDLRAVRAMRERQLREKIRTVSDARLDYKFAAGGLLELEYAVQVLQMHVGRPSTMSTLEAIASLEGVLPSSLTQTLRKSYVFYRELDIYSYLALERTSTRLPSEQKQIDILSAFCDISSGSSLDFLLSQTRKQTEEACHKALEMCYESHR